MRNKMFGLASILLLLAPQPAQAGRWYYIEEAFQARDPQRCLATIVVTKNTRKKVWFYKGEVILTGEKITDCRVYQDRLVSGVVSPNGKGEIYGGMPEMHGITLH